MNMNLHASLPMYDQIEIQHYNDIIHQNIMNVFQALVRNHIGSNANKTVDNDNDNDDSTIEKEILNKIVSLSKLDRSRSCIDLCYIRIYVAS